MDVNVDMEVPKPSISTLESHRLVGDFPMQLSFYYSFDVCVVIEADTNRKGFIFHRWNWFLNEICSTVNHSVSFLLINQKCASLSTEIETESRLSQYKMSDIIIAYWWWTLGSHLCEMYSRVTHSSKAPFVTAVSGQKLCRTYKNTLSTKNHNRFMHWLEMKWKKMSHASYNFQWFNTGMKTDDNRKKIGQFPI